MRVCYLFLMVSETRPEGLVGKSRDYAGFITCTSYEGVGMSGDWTRSDNGDQITTKTQTKGKQSKTVRVRRRNKRLMGQNAEAIMNRNSTG